MTDDAIERWLERAAQAAGLDGPALDHATRRAVLDLARDAAHAVERPAAPLTTYLAGIAVGRGADPAEVTARLSALAQEGLPAAE
ncbi:hypothetical protein FHX74_001846 [Friedmanniella endophytica]|uniref:DUF6457 domain-containing protein n=1 Tax=Microlunatus kandeliicorticis TaxID=1759536 RepID=A0A7W3IS30_9ACTN|nr:DUF6457 domain-containing protein [Microlunatus kandeliicorticis]MBA8794227.1 hypothetical protein [Microlunatus kandeliicorticis]